MKKSTTAARRTQKRRQRAAAGADRAAPLVSPTDAASGEGNVSRGGNAPTTSRRAATAEGTVTRSRHAAPSARRGVTERQRVPVPMPPVVPGLEGGGTLTRWRKKEGDKVALGDVLAEIETNVATLEIEATVGGVLQEILVPEGGTGILPQQPFC